MPKKKHTPQAAVDLEATAELPMMEFTPPAIVSREDEMFTKTDVYPADISSATVGEFEATLRDIEGRLQRRNEQVAKLTQELILAQQSEDDLATELAALQQSAGERETRLHAQVQMLEQQLLDLRRNQGLSASAHLHLEADLAEYRRRSERQLELLVTQQGYSNLRESMLVELEAPLPGERRKQQALSQQESAARQRNSFEADIQASASLYEETHDSLQPVNPVTAERRQTKHALLRRTPAGDATFNVGRRTTVGRTPENDIQIDESAVSRNHAVLLADDNQCVIEDLNSTNGVKVNGRRVDRKLLHDGDTIIIGTAELTYQLRA
jgi:FHA domain